MTLDARRPSFRFDVVRPILRSLAGGLLLVAGACSSGNHAAVGPSTPSTYTIGGTVSGLSSGATGLVLANGSTTVMVAGGATSFAFPTAVASGTAYAVTVQTSPSGVMCSVASGSGTVATANVSNIVVTCSTNSFTIGGTVAGLKNSGLVLQNGTDTVTVPANAASYTLPTPVASTSSYTVSVKTQPAGLNCSVANGSGTMPIANVTNINVTCSDQPFTLGGTVSGLNGSGLVLANGTDTVSVPVNATTFVLPTGVDFTAAYAVTVQTQPAGLTCTVSNGSGTMPAANVTSVTVTCSDQAFVLGGTVTGLTSGGLVVGNGSNTVTVASGATTFALPTPVAYTAAYAVTVQTQPSGLTCSVTNATGTMPANNVTSVTVTCAANSYTLGGSISGLHGSGLVLVNGTDTLSVASNATTFTMGTGVAYGSTYAVTIQTQAHGFNCTVTNGSGTMGAGNVTSVTVTCTQNPVWAYAADYNDDLVLQYSVDNATHLLSASPVTSFPTGQAPTFVTANAAGTVLYTADRAGNTITWFNIDPATGALSPGGSVDTGLVTSGNPPVGGYTPYQFVLNAAGTFAFVPDLGEDQISVFSVASDGSLTAVSGSPFLVPNSVNDTSVPRNVAAPSSIVLHPTLPLMYVTLFSDSSILTMNINPTTGELTQSGTLVPTGAGPYTIVINAAGTHAYSANRYSQAVYQYDIDSAGVLTQVANVPTTGTNPQGIALDPTGAFLYTANNGAGGSGSATDVDEYAVDPSTGALNHIGAAMSAANPSTVLVDSTGYVYVTNNSDPTQSISVFSADPATGVLTGLTGSASQTGAAVNGMTFAKP